MHRCGNKPLIKIKTTVTDKRNKAVEAFMKSAQNVKGSYVSVGFHEDAGKYDEPNAPDVVEVALWNEFGTRRTPERSFIRSAIDENKDRINEWRKELMTKVMTQG